MTNTPMWISANIKQGGKVMKFRPPQQVLYDDIHEAWESYRNVLAVLPTGGGKTVIFSAIVKNHPGVACVIAHRQELVSQISLTLNKSEVPHKIIAPPAIIKNCVKLHMVECGKSHYYAGAQKAVAGVDTLIRDRHIHGWCKSVSLWVIDEAHHVLRHNKWGKAVAMFENAKGLGVTATPTRADGLGLGAHCGGVFHDMVEGGTMRELINQGYLTDYRIFAPPSNLDISEVNVTSGGDYNTSRLTAATRKSTIMGDVVTHYEKLAMGEPGITFATDVESAHDIAENFQSRNIPAVAISAKTPDPLRFKYLNQLKHGDLLNVVNVDLFGEGVDVPHVKVVSFARKTESYPTYIQQIGRPLRVYDPSDNWGDLTVSERLRKIETGVKPHAKIIDHVGNVMRHGLPDIRREWSLDAREKKAATQLNEIPIRTCTKCLAVYERMLDKCPYCETVPVVANRSTPEFVDGDLMELDANTLSRMRGDVAAIDMGVSEYRTVCEAKHMPHIGVLAAMKRHKENQESQGSLRDYIALWAGHRKSEGLTDSQIYKKFYFTFGVDIMSAQALRSKESNILRDKISWTI